MYQDRNLKQRTLAFSEQVIRFAQDITKTQVNSPLIVQMVRSATSIGANYHEADNAESKDDFKHKVAIAKKEASETEYWFKLINSAIDVKFKDRIVLLQKEAHELLLILNSIYNKCR